MIYFQQYKSFSLLHMIEGARVNNCRRNLFCKGRFIEDIPPTEDALLKHVKLSTYQAGYVWGQYRRQYWTSLSETSIPCKELTKCGCKQGCQKRCKCKKSGLGGGGGCTALCHCKGKCEKWYTSAFLMLFVYSINVSNNMFILWSRRSRVRSHL